MFQSFQRLLTAPVFEDEDKTRVATLLNGILWTVISIGTAYLIIAPFLLDQLFSAMLTGSIVLAALFARSFMYKGYVKTASTILLVVFDLILIVSIVISDGTLGASYFSLVLTTVLAGVLLGGRGGFIMAIINTIIGMVVMIYQESLPETLIPQSPVTFFSSLIVYLFFIAALLRASHNGFEKIKESYKNVDHELQIKNQEMQQFTQSLELAIAARTEELNKANSRNERRAKQFEAIAKISRIISQAQNQETLLPQVVELISAQFDFYHTGVFLFDTNREYAMLIAANSAGGKKMLARNHKLKIGQTGIVGYVAGTGLPRIALDTGADSIYFNNPDLPETRSELALPLLRKGNEIIGVLDVQSKLPNAFSQEDVRTLSTLADQVAIAIENSTLFEEQRRILLEAQSIYSRDIQEGWARFARTRKVAGIQRKSSKSSFLVEPIELPGAMEAARSGRLYKKAEINGNTIITLPIKIREQVVGLLNVKANQSRMWSEDELDIVSAIVERAALSIENARLLEESTKVADREHAISVISTQIGTRTQIEDILRTAVQELGSQLRGTQVTVEIGDGE